MRNDLSLRPIIRRHLPEIDGVRAYLAGYGDEALALKFFDHFRDGQRKFRSVRTQDDYLELKEFAELFEKLTTKYYALSRENKQRLDQGYAEQTETKTPIGQIGATKSDYELFWNGFRYDTEDLPDEDAFRLPSDQRFHGGFTLLSETTALAFQDTERFDVYKRVNWSVCAVTFLAQMAWQKRTGNEAPNTAHADAPGPFGLFLEDILSELFVIYEMPSDTAPSARSALRALENITNSDIEFRTNW